MKIDITQIHIKTKPINDERHPDAVAIGSLTFATDDGKSISFSGFNLRKSKFNPGELYITGPSNKLFQFFRADKALKDQIQKEMIESYQWNIIPTIEN